MAQYLAALPSFLAILLSCIAAYTIWRRQQSTPSALILLVVCGWVAFISLFYFIEILSNDLEIKMLTSKFEYVGFAYIGVTWLVFVVHLVGLGQALTRRRLWLLLGIFPPLTIILAWTNELHHLMWTAWSLDESGTFPVLKLEYGLWFWLNTAWNYLAIFISSILLVYKTRTTSHSPAQVAGLLLISAFPILSTLLNILGFTQISIYNLNSLGFALSTLVLVFLFFRTNITALLPLAYPHIIDNIPAGVMVLDAQGRIAASNATLRSYAQTQQNLIGQYPENIFSQLKPFFLPLKEMQNGREQVQIGERSIDVQVIPLHDRPGRLVGRLAMFTDVSEHALLQKTLQERIEQLSLLRQVYEEVGRTLDTERVLPLLIDSALRLSGADGAFIALKNVEDKLEIHEIYGAFAHLENTILNESEGVTGRAIRTRQPQLVLDVAKDADYIERLGGSRAEIALPLTTGDEVIGLINLETLFPENFTSDVFDLLQLLAGRVASALNNARLHKSLEARYAEQQVLLDKISHLEQLKTDMIRIAAHDLANPLGSAMGYLEMLQDDSDQLSPEHRAFLGGMQRATERMKRIIKDFLSLQRIEQVAGGDTLHELDLLDSVRSVMEELGQSAQNKAQTLTLDADPATPLMLTGDPAQLYEAISNLVGNAIKYTPERGSIRLHLEKQEDVLIFEVIDNGYGVREDLQGRLFEPFYRAVNGITASIEGTGLGLHLVKNIVERHNGTMIFSSEEGKGSTFGFRLPCA